MAYISTNVSYSVIYTIPYVIYTTYNVGQEQLSLHVCAFNEKKPHLTVLSDSVLYSSYGRFSTDFQQDLIWLVMVKASNKFRVTTNVMVSKGFMI